MDKMKQYIALDIGGTAIKHGLISAEGLILTDQETPSEAHLGADQLLERVATIIENYIEREPVSGICISTAGVVDHLTGTIVHANDNIPGYSGTKLKDFFEARFGLPTAVENDARAAGLSEAYVGAAKDASIALCLTIGTGVGGAIIINKEVFHGAGHFAGEVGYMGMYGSDFEHEASTTALVQTVATAKDIDANHLNGIEVFEMAAAGDEIAVNAIRLLCEKIAYGIANIAYIINPEVVVLSGGVVKQWPILYPLIREELDRILVPKMARQIRLEAAVNGNRAGMLGAFWNFMKQYAKR